jgi:PBSX family phage portal protein
MNLIQAVKNSFRQKPIENNTSPLTFGDPISTVDTSHISDYFGTFYNNYMGYYQPPISPGGLVSLMRANPFHGTLVYFKANLLLKYLVTNALITRATAKKLAIDYNSQANAYLRLTFNRLGQVAAVERVPAIYMRVIDEEKGEYGYLFQGQLIKFDSPNEKIWHWKNPAPDQDIYGIPEWIGAVQSILLSEDTTLFARRFYKNGAHIGNLIVTSGMLPKEEAIVKEKLESGKGIGNFKTAHLGLPSGDISKSIAVLPIGQITDVEKSKLRQLSKTDILSAWRIRPELAGIAPENVGGSGDLEKIMMMNYENEIIPYQQDFLELNEYLPAKYKIQFDDANGKVF